jgi:hypothetical protein
LAESVGSKGVGFIDQDSQKRIVSQLVVVVEILVAQTETKDALFEQFEKGMFTALWITKIGETLGEVLQEAELGIDFTEKKSPGIGSDAMAVKASDDGARRKGLEKEIGSVTVCHSVRTP